MSRRLVLSLVSIILVILTAAGCGSRDRSGEGQNQAEDASSGPVATAPAVGQQGSTGVPQGSSAAEPKPTATSGSEETSEGALADVSPVDELDSYRAESSMSSTVDGAVTESWTMTIEYVKDPPARHTTSTSENGSTFDMIQIGNDSYIRSGEEWMAMSSTEGMENLFPAGAGISSEEYESEDCKASGSETVNGYASVHYVCDMDESAVSLGALTGTIQDVANEVWVSKEYKVPVKSVYTYTVKGSDSKLSKILYETTVTMINEPIAIEPPEGVAAPGVAEDVPVMEGAGDVFSMAGMTAYLVRSKTPAEVEAWYRDAMGAAGWTYDDSSTPPDALKYSKGERELVISLSASGADTNVTIMEQQ